MVILTQSNECKKIRTYLRTTVCEHDSFQPNSTYTYALPIPRKLRLALIIFYIFRFGGLEFPLSREVEDVTSPAPGSETGIENVECYGRKCQ